jgi:hypothetical protein
MPLDGNITILTAKLSNGHRATTHRAIRQDGIHFETGLLFGVQDLKFQQGKDIQFLYKKYIITPFYCQSKLIFFKQTT